MGTNIFIRNGLVAAMGVAGLTLSACASNGQHHDRYGSIYDYESGGSCDTARYGSCEAVVAQPAPMVDHGPVMAPVAGPVTGVVYADCSAIGDMNCGHSAPAPAPVSTHTEYSYSSGANITGSTVECPAGTSLQADGTCMQSSSYGSGSYTSTTTSSSSYGSYSSGGTAECPAGTTLQADGTCMQSSSSYTSTYSSGSVSSGEAVVCPAGTIMQADGTCMESSSSSYGGYSTSGGYSASDYLPIRK